MTTSLSPLTQGHCLLKGIIRGTGIFIAGFSALGLLIILPLLGLALFRHTETHGWLMLLFFIISAALFVILILVGYKMFRKIEVISIANFAFIFSYLLAKVFYHFLPPSLPAIIVSFTGDSPFFTKPDQDAFNTILAFAVFLISYYIIKKILMQVLKPNHTDHSQDPEIPGSDVPEFPKKSPLVPL